MDMIQIYRQIYNNIWTMDIQIKVLKIFRNDCSNSYTLGYKLITFLTYPKDINRNQLIKLQIQIVVVLLLAIYLKENLQQRNTKEQYCYLNIRKVNNMGTHNFLALLYLSIYIFSSHLLSIQNRAAIPGMTDRNSGRIY